MSDRDMTGEGIGQPVRRKEDLRLLTGKGQYAADYRPADLAYAAMVRTPHASARIVRIETAAAKAAPDVIAVFTGADFSADGRKPIPHAPNWQGAPDVTIRLMPGAKVYVGPHPVLPIDRVRYVGEPVAMVVAESLDAAKDAAELVEVEYETLPAVALASDAIKPGAARVWDEAPGNLSLDGEVGDKAATDAAFARAAHVVRLETWIQRVTGTPMEPRAATGALRSKRAGATRSGPAPAAASMRERQTLAGALGVGLESMPRDVRRHGRQFRHAQHLLFRIRAAALGGAADRPPGASSSATAANASSAIIRAAT